MDGRNVDLVEETIYHTSLKKKEHIFILLKQWIKPQNGKLRVTICLHLLLGLTPEDRHTSINWAGFHSTSTSDIKWDERQRDPAFWLRSAVQHHYFKKKIKKFQIYTLEIQIFYSSAWLRRVGGLKWLWSLLPKQNLIISKLRGCFESKSMVNQYILPLKKYPNKDTFSVYSEGWLYSLSSEIFPFLPLL